MSEKVKLPREVVEAIESLRSKQNGFSDYAIVGMMHEKTSHHIAEIRILDSHMGQGKMHPDNLIKALVNGYEVEQTTEEEAIQWLIKKRCIERGFSEHDIVMGIKAILNRGVNEE